MYVNKKLRLFVSLEKRLPFETQYGVYTFRGALKAEKKKSLDRKEQPSMINEKSCWTLRPRERYIIPNDMRLILLLI